MGRKRRQHVSPLEPIRSRNERVLQVLHQGMVVVAFLALGTLVLEYGVGVTPFPRMPFLSASLAVFFVLEILLKIILIPRRKTFLHDFWPEISLACVLVLHTLLLSRLHASGWYAWVEIELVGLYIRSTQIYLVLALLLRSIRYLQDVAILKLPPAQMVIVTFGSLIFLGTVALFLPRSAATEEGIHLIDALFTATSAVCVTGLTVLDTGKDFSGAGQGVILVLIQIGGLGIMTVTAISAILLGRGLGVRERAVLKDILDTKSIGSIMRSLGAIVFVTFLTEVIGALLIYHFWTPDVVGGQRVFFAVFHSISAFCNAGFSPLANSLEGQRSNLGLLLTMAGLITIGGLGFSVVWDLFWPRGRLFGDRRIMLQTRVVLTVSLALTLGGTLFLFLLSGRGVTVYDTWSQRLLDSFFQSVSARTAGFNSVPISGLAIPASLVLMYLMFIGASPGSTGGGIKTSTFGVLLAMLRTVMTNREGVEIHYRRIPDLTVRAATGVLFLAILLVAVSCLALSTTEAHMLRHYSPHGPQFEAIDYFFEVVSAFGTVGLSRGVTPHLSAPGKLIIIITMFLGRVGPLTILLALAQRKSPPQYRYPEEGVMVG